MAIKRQNRHAVAATYGRAEATDPAGHLETTVHRTAGPADQDRRAARPGAASRPNDQRRGKGGPPKAQQAFQRGLAGLAQWVEREEAHRPVPRKAVEVLPDGTETKLGAWFSNTRTRRDKLTGEQLDALRELGVEWA
ncbi:helicase associated domain-containing protein [Streptomyces flaveolus]|uniref:helicase associated domain-containing protein n=1 Tax=Streptomyces flaveolus TaxID=67297 RepID=UPI0037F8595E